MKKAIIALMCLALLSCEQHPAGTLHNVDQGNNPDIEVYEYFYAEGRFVYIAKFKSCPDVTTTTWYEQQGKTTVSRSLVSIDNQRQK